MHQANHPFKYPADVVDAFLTLESEGHAWSNKILAPLNKGPIEPPPTPLKAVLTQLVEVMFFASTATEEGRMNPVGAVFGESLDAFRSEPSSWDLVSFAPFMPFEVTQVAKLASVCDFPGSFLAVVPKNGILHIAGIATPAGRSSTDPEQLIRVIARKPGLISVCRHDVEVVRFEQGTLRVRSKLPKEASYRAQYNSINQYVMGDHARAANDVVYGHLMDIVEKMEALGRGGILAVLAQGEDLDLDFIKEPKKIEPPLHLGATILDEYEAHLVDIRNFLNRASLRKGSNNLKMRMPTDEEAHDKERYLKARENLGRLKERICRLATADGAVVMSHSLDVLAFGAKLVFPPDSVPQVHVPTRPGAIMEAPELFATRGTRHRSAAAFAAKHPGRLAFIVSEDGHAATFQQFESRLLYWTHWVNH